MAHIVSLNISATKGVQKHSVTQATVLIDHGIEGDAHAADWHRQISLLAMESIEVMRQQGLELAPGAFAENITTHGIDLPALPIGTRLLIGAGVELEITQIGKKCHTKCAIFHQAGDCIMPRQGVFAKVITPGSLVVGDAITIIPPPPVTAS